ncbi:hypothetical protein M569_07249 [Genlisea aurea]|uniref:Transcription factor IIIC subunit 5 HTH domain-containing protein n=1 Tax=Genlisea aurea TaxID=192259 RepID=S8E593_9LAMI|nr:hypothetical protein M569_07249 [Genlisea aurea]
MGLIEEGSISGVLAGSINGVFAVNYPGYPSSVERAIETLGGSHGILKVHADKSKKLELRFRPEDPYSHPAFGERQSCNNFLLKISKKKAKDVHNETSGSSQAESLHVRESSGKGTAAGNESESIPASSVDEARKKDGGIQDQLSACIVSRISEAYHFNGMADYQHVLPLHADSSGRKKRTWAEVEKSVGKDDLLDVDLEDIMILVPPLFSLKDQPEKILLKPCVESNVKKKPEENAEPPAEESSSVTKQMEIEPCLAIDFNVKDILNFHLFVPKAVNWEELIPRNSKRWLLQRAVCDLFDEHPIWPKSSLAERLINRGMDVANNVLRRLLFIAAYYFSNGPFLRFWIRKGYDPRKDPGSRVYQRTDFRVPPSLRSYCFSDAVSGLNDKWEDICAFRVFPRKCQISLQLFELKDDYIQEEIVKPIHQESRCSLQTGWFSNQSIESFRLRVAQRFLSIYPEAGSETLLKHVSFRFERTKRAHLIVKNPPKVGEKKDVAAEIEVPENENNDQVEEKEDEDDTIEDLVDDDLGEDPNEEDEELYPVISSAFP